MTWYAITGMKKEVSHLSVMVSDGNKQKAKWLEMIPGKLKSEFAWRSCTSSHVHI